ncbi:HEAT repeat-containing protein 1 [Neocloeon triangulifer]|uniref:HEAT repeat-containing protein 1 n=1 Tax=Neocloeon triangulifer TaxID=2078957 RepID=UPI00286F8135|nr:HEAT repeat-containing protein 1 [Neocloeon triangulifer]XP_059477981.1 HEAT repeat-containing protein 1 [Neocloeon triangulifer]XP_059477983.1 HEAT repeat-containing protein 1 [Neocloeon triangulifer]XP_059477984.1 HEAT repeat-containing protein 1 [Neocloeon triangulifer]XP_059477985.1 HEAT repeat-containing protein 1 [Neocloeon triangulifer]
MSTSLAQQLQKLQAPQTGQASVSRQVLSILFDTHTAEELTLDKAFQLGVQGLRDLATLNPRFAQFEDLLFRESSKSTQRAVETADFNQRLDAEVTKFLLMVSPHLMLKPALQTLEWLVHRFQIGEYSADKVLMCALPYHNTPTFCLILRAVPEIKKVNSTWQWLKPVLDSGTPLDVHTVHRMASKHAYLLRMILQHTLDASKEACGEWSRVQTQISFATSTVLGALTLLGQDLSQQHLACVAPYLHVGLSSPSPPLLASSLAVVAHLAANHPLSPTLNQELLTHLALAKVESLRVEILSVLILLMASQTRILGQSPKLNSFVVIQLAALRHFPDLLVQIQTKNQSLSLVPFLLPLMEAALGECRQEGVFFLKGVDKMVTSVLEKLTLDSEQATYLTRCLLENLPEDTSKISEVTWFSSACQILESRNPSVFDSVSKDIFSKDSDLQDSFHVILTNKGLQAEDGALTVQGICHQMVHPEEAIRASAVRSAARMLKTAKEEEKQLLQNCLRDRLKDESMTVLCAVLNLKNFGKLFGRKQDMFAFCLELLEYACHQKWNVNATALLVEHFGNALPDVLSEKEEVLAIMTVTPHIITHPFLYPIFARTKFGTSSALFQEIKNKIRNKEKKPEAAVLLVAVKECLQTSPFSYLEVVEKRLESHRLKAIDLCVLSYVLRGVALTSHTAHHKAECFRLAVQVKSRAKNVLPRKPAFPPLGKAEELARQVKNMVQNDLYPVSAFVDVVAALVQKPLRSNVSDMTAVLKHSLSSVVPSEEQNSVVFESSCNFKWQTTSLNDDSEKSEFFKLAMSIMAVLLELCSKVKQSDEEQPHMSALRSFIMANCSSFEGQLHFLSLMWSQNDLAMEDRMRALIFATSIVKLHLNVKTDNLMLHSENSFVPAVLCALSNPETYLRQVTVKLITELAKLRPLSPAKSYHPLIEHLSRQADEMVQHNDQLGVALYPVLTEDDSAQSFTGSLTQQVARDVRECLFSHVVDPLTPRDVAASLLKALVYIKSEQCLKTLTPMADLLLDPTKDDLLDSSSFQILTEVLQRIDADWAEKFFSSDDGWFLFGKFLKSKLAFEEKSISVSAVQIVTKEVFNSLSEAQKPRVVHLLLEADNEASNLKAAVASVLRKLPLGGELVAEELKAMARKTKGNEGTQNWSRGVVLLESLVDKKKMANAAVVIPVLFEILKICVEGEEDEEYAKQLALGSLNSLLAINEEAGLKCQVDIELIVNSLKSSSNPQTQREALVLLCHTAHMVPENLLHYLASVFTFVGTQVLRHDDEYSLQIISQVISKVVPAVMKGKGQSVGVITILRVFSDAFPDIPSHRRLLIFEQLMTTVGWDKLWLFLVLAFESHAYAQQHSSRRVECVLEATKTCPLPVLLRMLLDVVRYLTIFTEMEYGGEKRVSNALEIKMKFRALRAAELIDPCTKPAADVRKLQIVALDFLSNVLSVKSSASKGFRPNEKLDKEMEALYRSLMDSLMSYLLAISHQEATLKTKFWSCLLVQGYSVLNKVNMLLPLSQFVSVVQGVLTNTSALDSVKSKTLELLGAKLQLLGGTSDLQELLPLVDVCQSLAHNCDATIASKALFCLRLLVGLLGSADSTTDNLSRVLTSLLGLLAKVVGGPDHPVTANLLLCLAELVHVLRVHMLKALQELLPATLKAARSAAEGQVEIVLLASLALLQRLVEVLPQFLSSFLQAIFIEVCQVAVIPEGQVSPKAYTALQHRNKKIQDLLSSNISLRVLLPPLMGSFHELSRNQETLASVRPLMAILISKLEGMTSSEIAGHVPELSNLFLEMLELRSVLEEKEPHVKSGAAEALSEAEGEVVSALVAFVLKLQEPVFKPLFFKLFNWAREAEQNLAHRSRCITFYRLSTSLASKLKGLFTVFVPIYLKQAAHLLQVCQLGSTEEFFGPDGEAQTLLLLDWLLANLLEVFTQDKQRFVKQDAFDLIMQPLVDQLENEMGGEAALVERRGRVVGACVAQLARCTQDDVLWKQLHYQVLLKARSPRPQVRLVTVDAVLALAEVLREDLLPLLPEAVPFIAELMEDDDLQVEKKTHHVARQLEKILGEPLDKYF